jgi:hypothetical protein
MLHFEILNSNSKKFAAIISKMKLRVKMNVIYLTKKQKNLFQNQQNSNFLLPVPTVINKNFEEKRFRRGKKELIFDGLTIWKSHFL